MKIMPRVTQLGVEMDDSIHWIHVEKIDRNNFEISLTPKSGFSKILSNTKTNDAGGFVYV